MIFLRSLAFNLLFYVWVALFSFTLTLVLWLPRRWLQEAIGLWMRSVMAMLTAITGLGYEVRGWSHMPPGPALVASKHQSAWDTGIYYVLLHNPAYVLKRELTWIPFYGWVLSRVRSVAVDRTAGGAALKSLVRQSRVVLEEGRPVVIFPEGTRKAVGAAPAYQPGIAALDRATDLPVIPVALNSGLYWGRRSFLRRPGKVVVEFLPAMPKGLDRRAFMAELESRIETATARLVAEAQATAEAPAKL